jgi:hypothetical protein
MNKTDGGKSPNSPHSHKYTIADDDAVETLMHKLENVGVDQAQRKRIQQAIESATEEYRESSETERKAFFHGMLTGIAVGLKVEDTPLREPGRSAGQRIA